MHTALPLSDFLKFRSYDIDESRRKVSEVFCPHQLLINGNARRLCTQFYEATLGRSSLVYITYGTAVSIDADCLGHCFLVQIPWTGRAKVVNGSHEILLRAGTASVISPSHPLRMQWSDDCGFYTVRLDRNTVEKKLARMLGEELRTPLVFEPIFDLSTPAGRTWVNGVDLARRQVEIPLPIAAAESLLLQLEETLCLMLLQLLQHNYTFQLQSTSVEVTPKTIRRAREYIGNNIQQSITVDELAAVTGVAAATLTKHFKYYLGHSPMEYVREQKLEAVRRILRHADPETSVTDIAIQYAFNHLGRFAEYYRRRYGELPSDTLKQMKRTSG